LAAGGRGLLSGRRMETKANTALIGAFTLIVLAFAFVFVYWLARGAGEDTNAHLTVIFEDPVTGLSVGSQVVFNGIKIGDVKTLDLDPQNPKNVIAGLDVTPKPSVKADTQVTLGFQGLTGVGYIEMAGGSPSLPPIWEAQPSPTIIATRSSMQDLLSGARTILSRADETLQKLEQTISDNSDDISLAVLDVRKFTSALAANSDDVGKLVANVSTAATKIADATTRLDGIVGKSEKLIAAIDPDDVRQTLANIRATSDSFAAQAGRVGAIVDRVDAVASGAQAFAQHLPALGDKADALLAAVDPEKVNRTLDNIDQFTTALGENTDDIRQIVANAKEVSARFQSLGDRADSLLAKLDSMAGQGSGGLLQDASDTLASIRAAADNFNKQVSQLGTGLGDFNNRGLRDFQSLVAQGQRTIGRLDHVISDLESNPTGFLLGGENVPQYSGRRR
jgi:phospholipid/cholesterol/gamma-HCH transport system substrate-binding protein